MTTNHNNKQDTIMTRNIVTKFDLFNRSGEQICSGLTSKQLQGLMTVLSGVHAKFTGFEVMA